MVRLERVISCLVCCPRPSAPARAHLEATSLQGCGVCRAVFVHPPTLHMVWCGAALCLPLLRVAPKAHKSGSLAATSGNTAPHSVCRACCRFSRQQSGLCWSVVPCCDVGGEATLSGYGTLIGVPYVTASSHTSNVTGPFGSQPAAVNEQML